MDGKAFGGWMKKVAAVRKRMRRKEGETSALLPHNDHFTPIEMIRILRVW